MASKVKQLLLPLQKHKPSAVAGGALLGGVGVISAFPQARKFVQGCIESAAKPQHSVYQSTARAFDTADVPMVDSLSSAGLQQDQSTGLHDHADVAGVNSTVMWMPIAVVPAVVCPMQPMQPMWWQQEPPQNISFMPPGWTATYIGQSTDSSTTAVMTPSSEGTPRSHGATESAKLRADILIPKRTGASRRQRRRKQDALQAEAHRKAAAMAKQDETPLTSSTREDYESTDCVTFSSSDVDTESTGAEPVHYWPATPDDTPPASPRAGFAPMLDFHTNFFQHHLSRLLPSSAAAVIGPDSVAQAGDGLDELCNSAWSLAMTEEGCRQLQDAIERMSSSQTKVLTEQLHGHAAEAAVSPFGNHVLQKCISQLPTDRVQFILDEISGSGVAFAKNRFGCRVIERLIEHFPLEKTRHLVDDLVRNAETLCRHAFANFVMQHIIEHGLPEHRSRVVDVLKADVHRLAKHRVASHVVKRALVHASVDDRTALAEALLSDHGAFADLMHHHCGSFVANEVKRSFQTSQSH
eukprot:TRINITY_DN9571_c0_g1_i1.p1 TRINITY_DN9571_c0_g1~~TRINITY_DN9571_c0_g1_i1.p1  ORF type:complete len:524 (+),score=105.32 TRINITY_DN9571_c0_g1_i1:98-1669(+)